MPSSALLCRILSAIIALISLAAVGQVTGRAPGGGLPATDIFRAFRLPPFKDGARYRVGRAAAATQLGIRNRRLGLNGSSAIEAWRHATSTSASVDLSGASAAENLVSFTGSTASGLNVVLADPASHSIRVDSLSIFADEPISVNRPGIQLDLGRAEIRSAGAAPYIVRIENTQDVIVRNGVFTDGDSAVLVHGSDGILISRLTIRGVRGAAIVVSESRHVAISDNHITGLRYSGVMLTRGTASSLVTSNRIENNAGTQNMAAAIVLTDREVDVVANPHAIFAPDGYGVLVQELLTRMNPPRENVISHNQLAGNQSSGIYVDGGVLNIIESNTIEGNAKEGVCLDNGASANVVTGNLVLKNGRRWGESDAVIAAELIAATGRLPDGTAAAKVPGISLDNAMYNVIFDNNVSHNFGGGIKIVRTGFFNAIGMNTLMDNNDGSSGRFHYFGIELGAAPADASTKELDITPSRGNIVFANLIRGNHYAGIFFANNSDSNDVLDNTILDCTHWALEAVKPMPNSTLNNLTNLSSRNVGSGLDPALFLIGRPVLDVPKR